MKIRDSKVLAALLLMAAIAFIYRDVVHYDYLNFDDSVYVTDNAMVKQGLTVDSVKWALSTQHAHYWGPVTWLSFISEVQAFGLRASVSHTINVLLHLANSLLLYALLRVSTRAAFPSLVVALLFAVHPLHVESVVWVTERKDVLSTFFGLLALCAYVRYSRMRTGKNQALVVMAFTLAVCTKPLMVTLPVMMWILDVWPLQDQQKNSFAQQVREKLPLMLVLLLVSLLVVVITLHVQKEESLNAAAQFASLPARLAHIAADYLFYLYHLLVPVNLSVFYPRSIFPAMTWLVAAVIVLPLLSFVAFRQRKQQPWLLAGWLWYLVTLLPMSGIITFGRNVAADRFTYIPSIGIFIMVVWTLESVLPVRKYPRTVFALWACVFTGLLITAHRQTTYWKNDLTLFQHAADVTQDNYLAYNNIGNVFLNQHEAAKALPLFEQANRLFPGDRETLNNLGLSYDLTGHQDAAAEIFRREIALFPDYSKPYVNLASLLTRQKNYDDAIPLLKKALQLDADNEKALNNLAAVYLLVNQPASSIALLQYALELKPDNASLYYNLGYAYYLQGNTMQAIAVLEHAQALQPDNQATQQLLVLVRNKSEVH